MAFTTAQRRAYQRICDRDSGRILVIAMDQRNSMKKLIEGVDEAGPQDLVNAKLDLVAHLGNEAPALLLDPTTVIPQVVDDGVLAPDTALMVGMDATGYAPGEDGLRKSAIVEGVDAARVRAVGGDVAKMNVYMRPDREGLDSHPARIIRDVVEDCAANDVLVAIEILTYALEDEPPEDYQAKAPELVAQAAAIARECGAPLMKLQYPGSLEGCRAVTEVLGDIPWAVLSAGVDHETFIENLRISLQGGASGAIAGRSLWKDCLRVDRAATANMLRERAVPRLRELQGTLAEQPA
ncbi:MAG: tagatose-bisphosphate aldolase [Candidatus Limnocylindrales bacterium]